MAVSLDGVMAPMKDGQRQAKRTQARATGKAPSGPAGYQEVGCATVSYYDRHGERLCTRRMARMPEPNKATLKSQLTAEVMGALTQRRRCESSKWPMERRTTGVIWARYCRLAKRSSISIMRRSISAPRWGRPMARERRRTRNRPGRARRSQGRRAGRARRPPPRRRAGSGSSAA